MAAVVAVLSFVSASVRADTPASADEEFETGRQLLEQEKFQEACAHFEKSQNLEPAATTLLNLGVCREMRGELATAIAVFRAAETMARAANTSRDRELATVAAGHVERLQRRVSTLTIVVPPEHRIDGLIVERAGTLVDSRLWDLPVPVDGGAHRIIARAPGREDWSTTVDVKAAGDVTVVRVPSLALASATRRATNEVPRSEEGTAGSLVWPIALGGVALAAGFGALAFELHARTVYDQATAEHNWDRQDELWHRANRNRYAAQAFAVSGIGCAALAVWLYVRRGQAQPAPVATPLVGADTVGFGMAGAF
jgi:hypothetical protein